MTGNIQYLTRFIQSAVALGLLVFVGCSKTEKNSATQQQTQKPTAASAPTALQQESNPKCVGPFTTTPAKELEIAGVKYSQNGAVLNQVKSDEDNDGIIDIIDECPHTPKSIKVDLMGCPIDTDKDGVPDHIDQELNSKNYK